ncbi:MAG TPA: DUF2794 domain-containing protein [Roseiarcus sp.]|jgi:hypothetical protein|nr:DUF2794 domain-containing protein [Roseiarcus sp.]
MSEVDPPQQRRAPLEESGAPDVGVQYFQRSVPSGKPHGTSAVVSFSRRELQEIMDLYGRMVAAGEWRDYALDFTPDQAIFSVFRRACETPLYRIKKDPKLARRQGAYSVVAIGGLVMKRGHELARVIGVLEPRPKLAAV